MNILAYKAFLLAALLAQVGKPSLPISEELVAKPQSADATRIPVKNRPG